MQWEFYIIKIISFHAWHAANIVQDDTPIGVNYERPWKYKLHKMYNKTPATLIIPIY